MKETDKTNTNQIAIFVVGITEKWLLMHQLQVASSSLPSDIRRLTEEKQLQPSH